MSLSLTNLQQSIASIAGLVSLAGLILSFVLGGNAAYLAFFAFGTVSLMRFKWSLPFWIDGALAAAGALILMMTLGGFAGAPAYVWMALVAVWFFSWLFIEQMSQVISAGKLPEKPFGLVIPLTFGLMLLFVWETLTIGAQIPQVLLPAPSLIWERILESGSILYADFIQTFVKSVLTGYALGCGAGFVVAILADRSPFLKRGLLPIGNFVSALPIIGIAPIMVMWFGFDWPSKAAVVVAVTFFPMLVNTVAGLNESGSMERDLMRTYAANYWQTLFGLRLPMAMPFIFNALKINSTFALIGAIVAEFFGTPIVGMGFRISTEVGKLNIDLVWAEIAVAAVAGSAFYGIIALIERAVTFWHPSVRGGRV